MSDVLEEVAEVQRRVEVAQRKEIEAKTRLEAAQAEYDRELAQLQTEFNVATVDDAKALLSKINTALTEEVARVKAELDKAEGL